MQKQRFIQIIHRFVIKLHVYGNSGKAIQLALGRSRTSTEFGPHKDWEWNCKVIWNPGRFQECWTQQAWIMTLMFHRFHDSSLLHGMFSSSYRQISSTSFILSWLPSLWTLITSCIMVPLVYFSHTCLLLLKTPLSCYFSVQILDRKNLVGSGLVLWQSEVISTELGTLVQKSTCGPISWEDWVEFHMTPHMLPNAFSFLGELAFQSPLEKNYDFIVEDIPFKKSCISSHVVMMNEIMLLYTCQSQSFSYKLIHSSYFPDWWWM